MVVVVVNINFVVELKVDGEDVDDDDDVMDDIVVEQIELVELVLLSLRLKKNKIKRIYKIFLTDLVGTLLLSCINSFLSESSSLIDDK